MCISYIKLHPTLVLRPSCIPEKVGIYKKWYAISYKELAKNIVASQRAERVQTTDGCKLAQGIKEKKA